jgi:DNA-binding NtrC family response regulator/tetratricopeptide (TPR) repeat protein
MELLTEELLSGPAGARALTLRAHAALAVGRHEAALEAARHARRLRGAEPTRLALTEGEALLRLGRPAEALAVVPRALERRPEGDLAARLHLVQAEALGLLGRLVEGERQTARAEALAAAELTLARLDEIRGLLAWARQDPAGAQARLPAATQRYAACQHAQGVVRALERQALVLRHAGCSREALALVGRRLDLAATTTRLDSVARAHHDRAVLLADLGRLAEARAELLRSSDMLVRLQHPQATTLVGATACRLALLTGDLPGARERLEALAGLSVLEPRLAAETALLRSDVLLAEGSLDGAEQSGAEAVRLFRACRDVRGTARARLRLASALLALRRTRAGLLEARRAARLAVPSPPIRALAELNVGRALLRLGHPAAADAFRRAAQLCPERESLVRAAEVGVRLALRATAADPELRAALQALERTGDQRLLAACREELRLRGLATDDAGSAAEPLAHLPLEPPEAVAPLLAAVERLGGEGEWGCRVGAALGELLGGAPWSRAGWLGASAWLWTRSSAKPAPLPPDDPWRSLAGQARSRGATVTCCREGRRVVAPAPGGWLVVELGGEAQEAASLVAALAHLLPEPPVATPVRPGGSGAPGLLGTAPPMQELFARLELAGASETAVHVFGETGSGKELVARAVHQRSRRAARPFVAVNASSLSDELFESELFGHVRGAFTGALNDRPGLVAEAEGGTLFLDEVADLSLKAQAKLLRFCQDLEYRRVGETVLRRANVRIVSAANQRLEALVAAGRFREDLMHRLRVMQLDLPPLRARREDVVPLARHFLRAAAAREGRQAPELSRSAAELLAAHAWPGNVRELEGEMACAVALCEGARIEPGHLSKRLRTPALPAGGGLREARARWERGFVAESLRRHEGRRSHAAAALGISRQALMEKMRSLGL